MALSHEEKISRFVDSIDKKLQKMDSTYSHLSVILSKCGWEGKGPKNLERITGALEARDIYADAPLTTRRGYSALIHFKRDPWPDRLLLANEGHLRDYLMRNFDRIDEFTNLEDPKAEYQLEWSGNRIDILCRERDTRSYVVIELKLDDDDPVKQMGDYLTEVAGHVAKERFDVKGIVITGRPMALATDLSTIGGFPVTWLTYSMDLKLAET